MLLFLTVSPFLLEKVDGRHFLKRKKHMIITQEEITNQHNKNSLTTFWVFFNGNTFLFMQFFYKADCIL